MSNLQTYYHFKLDFQNVDQHTGGKWLTHGTKRRKDNQLQSLELPCRIPWYRECKHDINESECNMFIPTFKKQWMAIKIPMIVMAIMMKIMIDMWLGPSLYIDAVLPI